jgi:nucleoside-diphosphate-sugar epimerase
MKVLVTGGSGLIGGYCLPHLQAKGYEVHAVSSVRQVRTSDIHWHKANLLKIEQVRRLMRTVKPSHLLHLAWCTDHAKYWTSQENLNWVQSSLALIQEFTEWGGKRLVVAGTCAEYEWGHGICVEDHTPLIPGTLYGNSKHALQVMLRSWSVETGLSSAWGRVFSLYGPRENSERLVTSVIKALLDEHQAICGNSQLIRDYLHVADVASAFVTILDSSLEGPVNIGSGEGVTLGEIVKKIAMKLDRSELIQLRVPSTYNEPLLLKADISRLTSTGWKNSFDLDRGLADTIAWMQKVLVSAKNSGSINVPR